MLPGSSQSLEATVQGPIYVEVAQGVQGLGVFRDSTGFL